MQVVHDYPPGVVGIVTSSLGRYREFDMALGSLTVPDGSQVTWQSGLNICLNFNGILRQMLADPKYKWAFTLGDDHTFSPDILLRLLKHDVDVVVPLVARRLPAYDPVLHEAAKNGYQRIYWNYFDDKDGLIDITHKTVGNAGMLIKREVIEGIREPWFEAGKMHPELNTPDLWFSEKLRAHGFKTYMDLNTTIGHITHTAVWPQKRNGKWGVVIRSAGDFVGNGETPVVENYFRPVGALNWKKKFNEWREHYDEMDYKDQIRFFFMYGEAFPVQFRYSRQKIFNLLAPLKDRPKVLEIGGWRGEMAYDVFNEIPHIERWLNVEICQQVVENSVCSDERYEVGIPDDFIWNVDPGQFEDFDVLVMSHVVEFMRARDFEKIIGNLKLIKNVYLECSICEKTEDVDWTDHLDPCIYEWGWDRTIEVMEKYGYKLTYQEFPAAFFARETEDNNG